MQSSARWWARRPRASVAALVAIAVTLSLVAAAAAVTAVIRLPARGASCNAATVTAEVAPSLVGVGTAAAAPRATGTLVRGNGVILTSTATIPDSGALTVTLADGEAVPARLLGTDPDTSLAVLKIDREQLPFLLPSPREPIEPGLPVVALGSPLIEDAGVLSGTVHSLGSGVTVTGARPWQPPAAITTDLTAPGGNLGGPLVTCDARMVGVVVGRLAADGTSVAIPAEQVQRVVARLLGLS